MIQRAMPAGVFTLLVGPPKPERSWSRVQTKVSCTALQVWGLGLRLTTSSCTETTTRTINNLHTGVARSPKRMTVSGKSQKETIGMKLEVRSAKTKTRLGFWNVHTMYETGKVAQLTAEVRRCRLHILGVSESRWTGAGRMKTVSGEAVLYLGRDDEQQRDGVAIILKKGGDRSLLEWKPIKSCMVKARLKVRHNNLTLTQCYAPTNGSDDNLKDNFYLRLQTEIEQVSIRK